MALTFGPKLGLLIDGVLGEEHYDELMAQWRALDALIQSSVIDMALMTPPASPLDGDMHVVASVATGAWAGQEKKIARWSTVLTAWEFYAPKKGWRVYNINDGAHYLFDGTSWAIDSSGGGSGVSTVVAGAGIAVDSSDPANPSVSWKAPTVVAEAGTSLLATAANAGRYTRFTAASAKTYTFNSTETYTVGDEYHARNVGAGNLTLTPAGSFVLNAPAGGSLVVPPGATVTLKIVAAAEADVMGYTEAP